MSRRNPVSAEEFLADVTDLSHEGQGITRSPSGKVVFVHGALPGERVRYRLTRARKDHDEAEVVGVERASPDRVTPRCAYFGVCGGCALQHLAPQAQLAFKQKQLLDAFTRIGKVQPEEIAPPLTGPVWGYRRRARLSVRHVAKKGDVLVGFRERQSPFVTAMDRCEVLDPRIGERLKALADLIESLTVRDAIPQIEIAAVERAVVLLRVMRPIEPADRDTLRAFAQKHGLEIWLQPHGNDSAAPLETETPPLTYPLPGGLQLQFTPTDFVQINAAVNDATVAQALDWLSPTRNDRVLELFCGLGNFSLPLARTGAQVTAIEGEAGLVERARTNALSNGVDIRFHRGDLFKPDPTEAWMQARYDLALLDPPRLGAAEILPHLAAFKPRRIVYVSCHPGTLARDAATLVHQHGYRLVRAGVMDMFPHTTHIESMALFSYGN